MSDSDTLRTLTLITAPPGELLTLDDAKAHLRIDHTEEDGLVAALITAARQHIDGKDGWLGRALATQTWQLGLTAFPCGAIRVPLPPLQSVDSITYIDTNGDEQTLAESAYQIVESEPALILPAYGTAWPAVRCQAEAVKVRFTAGYDPGEGSPTDYAENVPQPIKQALLLLVAHWHQNRLPVSINAMPWAIPFTVQALLMPYRSAWL